MRTNIDIDDDLLAEAMKAGPYTTKKETVEAGLRLLARQAAYREILKWRGKLPWDGDESVDWTVPEARPATLQGERAPAMVQEPRASYRAASSSSSIATPSGSKVKRHGGR